MIDEQNEAKGLIDFSIERKFRSCLNTKTEEKLIVVERG